MMLPYDILVDQAHRAVVMQAMMIITKRKPSDKPHVNIRFLTKHKDARVPEWLLAKYPKHMDLVFQHTFHDLRVTENMIKVTLQFDGKVERIHIPKNSILNFSCAASGFALNFDGEGEEIALPVLEKAERVRQTNEKSVEGNVVTVDKWRKK